MGLDIQFVDYVPPIFHGELCSSYRKRRPYFYGKKPKFLR